MRSITLRKLLAGKVILLVLAHILVFSYVLPRVDVIRVVDTEIKRVDATNKDGSVSTRDVYQIQGVRISNEKPRVYRNEDNWFYLKPNSANLQTEASNHSNKEKTVAITMYGWRFTPFSWFPNAIDIKPVDDDYRHIPVFNIFFLLAYGGLVFFLVRKSVTFSRNVRERAEERQEKAAETRQRKDKSAQTGAEGDGLDEFLSS